TALAAYRVRLDEGSVSRLAAGLERALVDGDDEMGRAAARALLAVSGEPELCVSDHFSHDAELRRMALRALADERTADAFGRLPTAQAPRRPVEMDSADHIRPAEPGLQQ